MRELLWQIVLPPSKIWRKMGEHPAAMKLFRTYSYQANQQSHLHLLLCAVLKLLPFAT